MSGKRMPQLVMDEVILLVDTYFQLQDISDTSIKNELINELSKNCDIILWTLKTALFYILIQAIIRHLFCNIDKS